LTELKRPPKDLANLAVEWLGQIQLLAVVKQVFALPYGQAVVLAVPNGSFGARLDAFCAKQAVSKVDPEIITVYFDCICWARFGTRTAPVGTL
jgi:hypothetical protein